MSVIRTVISRILTVRCLAANDLPRLFQLEQHPSSNRWIWHAWPVDHAARAGGIWVASIQNLMVGYLAYKVVPESGEAGGPPHGNGAGPQTLPPARRLSLLRLLVAPEWRRRRVVQPRHCGQCFGAAEQVHQRGRPAGTASAGLERLQ